MLIVVTATGVEVREPRVLDALAVLASEPERARERLVAAGLARVPAGESGEPGEGSGHVWLDVATLEERAAPGYDEEWTASYRSMVAYAASRGWTADGDTLVRAHVETGRP